MKATHCVKNHKNQTTGFVVDGSYVQYYNALNNVDLIDNLSIDSDGNIKSSIEDMPVIDIREINQQKYQQDCVKAPLIRDVQHDLEKWRINWSNYVLYVTGARQIGKTTELLKFAYKNYEQVVYVNLSVEKTLQCFEETVLSNSLFFGMVNYCRKAGLEEFCNDENTILIIDEIQESPSIYNSIRGLQNELKCHVAVTGSYLGKVLNSKYFKPAGNMYEIEMLPLSFAEFCRAFDLEKLLFSINIYGKSSKEDYVTLTEKYKVYRNIGGYPAVVNTYIQTQNIDSCYEVIKSIIERFTEESATYFENDKCAVVFENVYKAAFMSMLKEKRGTSAKDVQDITEFIKEDTKEHVSRKEINNALAWLKYSKLIGSCDLYNQGNVNDLLSERRFYFLDCGIASYIAGLTPINNDAVEGAIAENFVYSELYRVYKSNKLKGDKPCCSVYAQYELDFMLVDKEDKKYGIEVKASKSNKHDSLDCYLRKKFIDEAYLAEITRGGIGEEIRTIPIYTVGCRFPYHES